MTQRQLNMIQSAQEGIELARSELTPPVSESRVLAVIRDNILPDGYSSMSVGRAAYLACYIIAWREIGSPDPYG